MAKQHIVTCRICKEKFDAVESLRDIDWIMPSKNWYYHARCYKEWKDKNHTNDADWKDRIYDFIARDLKVSYDYHLCEAQLDKYIKKDKIATYKGIYFTLKYFYEIKHGDWRKGHGGLGIIPFIYQEAVQYWIEKENRERGTIDAIERQIREREAVQTIVYKEKKVAKKKKLWNLEDFNE